MLIQPLDISGEVLEPAVRHQYLDLSLQQDDETGRDTAIILPRRDARSFRMTVEEVIFGDNSRWHSEPDANWEQLPKVWELEEATQLITSFLQATFQLSATTLHLWELTLQ